MSRGAKEEIIDVFCKELKTMSMDKITVTEIIEKSGVSRNTFYYHFEDIYDLLRLVIDREQQKLTESSFQLQSWQDVLRHLIRYARTHKKEIYHIFNALPRERIEQYIFTTTKDILYQIVRLDAKGLDVSEEDMMSIAIFYQYAITGFFLRFLWGNMEMDADTQIDKLSLVFDDNIHHVLEKCAERNKHNKYIAE